MLYTRLFVICLKYYCTAVVEVVVQLMVSLFEWYILDYFAPFARGVQCFGTLEKGIAGFFFAMYQKGKGCTASHAPLCFFHPRVVNQHDRLLHRLLLYLLQQFLSRHPVKCPIYPAHLYHTYKIPYPGTL